jgi:hypothetical protein
VGADFIEITDRIVADGKHRPFAPTVIVELFVQGFVRQPNFKCSIFAHIVASPK